jgi:hypothetical protein
MGATQRIDQGGRQASFQGSGDTCAQREILAARLADDIIHRDTFV